MIAQLDPLVISCKDAKVQGRHVLTTGAVKKCALTMPDTRRQGQYRSEWPRFGMQWLSTPGRKNFTTECTEFIEPALERSPAIREIRGKNFLVFDWPPGNTKSTREM